ncbi:SCO family protein [Salinimicrobium oceani]|uniref:SCO family protein n=1 Tax=Salinimicrobium oceani TaxID=2722702 RepID=A0ABX1CVM1_9FLAO|nr:SCO family protein [Salinimicrobium oceani]NJW52341.1 SCO family protein [Salinimicrobium oceani]
MKKSLLIVLSMLLFSACNKAEKKTAPTEDQIAVNGSSSLDSLLPELSIYNLPSTWTTQDNEHIQLEELRGNVLVMVMIYTSCKAACPRLIADMRNIEKQIPATALDKTKFIMVSIDPETDTPQRLQVFSKENEMEDEHWMFLRGTPEDTREFATVLAVSYKKISPLDFSHSNIISVFNEDGVLVHQQEGLGVDNSETVAAIKTEVQN